MSGPIDRTNKFRRRKNKNRRRRTAKAGFRPLRFETLEDRRVLAAGIVDIFTDEIDLYLNGDASNNEVSIEQVSQGSQGQYLIKGLDGTLLTLNDYDDDDESDFSPVFDMLTISGIWGDIFVDLNYHAEENSGGGLCRRTCNSI